MTPYRLRQQGVALVLILVFMAMLTVMIVAFFSLAATERTSSTSEDAVLNARQLADSTTQFVISQIRQATSGGVTNGWASQPGMIRTFDSQGVAAKAYKLYSAGTMVETVANTGYNPSGDMPASPTWADDRAIWCDLNTPVIDGDGGTVFPILDPRAKAVPDGKTDPMVEGFSYDASAVAGALDPANAGDINARVPMPVRWLYLLRDGQFTSPSGGTGDRADFSASDPKPTADNPIVGRVAFWTDDETCKLNVNTACGGNPWDIPTYTAGIDLSFSRYKPVKNEYARYPGHPATTSLKPVFWSFAGLDSPDFTLAPTLNPKLMGTPPRYRIIGTDHTAAGVAAADVAPELSPAASEYYQKLLSFSPRNMWGGSQMGSVATVVNSNGTMNAQPIDSDRLFATTDEAFFAMPTAGESERPANAVGLQDEDVGKLRFFLTAQSRSPDTNPLNQPKVGIWPIPDPTKTNPGNPIAPADDQTPIDKLLAFCSTLNGQPYYFTRNNPDSPNDDFAAGSRNDQIFDYLDRGLNENLPGFGGSLGERYGVKGTRRILTQIYDYIRGSLNLTDTFGGTGHGTASPSFPHAFVAPRSGFYDRGAGQVVPIVISKEGEQYKGHGRFITIKEAGLHFIASAANQPPLKVVESGPNTGRPLLFLSDGATPLLDAGGNLTANGLAAVLGGNAYAVLNPLHPAVTVAGTPDPSTIIQQAMEGGVPILAVNQTKLDNNPNDTSAIYPVFNPPNRYPTIGQTDSSQITEATARTISMVGGASKSIVYNGPSYPFKKAECSTLPADLQVPAQTHAGLPFLTIPRTSGASTLGNMEGAYDVPNPRYQTAHLANASPNGGVLSPGKTQVQSAFLIAPIIVNPGSPPYKGNYKLSIRGLDTFRANGESLGFASPVSYEASTTAEKANYSSPGPLWIPVPLASKKLIVDRSNTDGKAFAFTGGNVTIEIFSLPSEELIQTVHINFPNATFPTPLLPPMPVQNIVISGSSPFSNTYRNSPFTPSTVVDLTCSPLLTFDSDPNRTDKELTTAPNTGVGASVYQAKGSRLSYSSQVNRVMQERMADPEVDYHAKLTADTVRTMELLYGDARIASTQATVPNSFFRKHAFYDDPFFRSAHSIRESLRGNLLTGATEQPLSVDSSGTGLAYSGTNSFRGKPKASGLPPQTAKIIQTLAAQMGFNHSAISGYIASSYPNVTSSVDFSDAAFSSLWQKGGDYDTGQGLEVDGPYINKANEGGGMRDISLGVYDAFSVNPEFSELFQFSFQDLNNSPSRQVASPVIFGSLVAGDTPEASWRTLLFSPNPNSVGHPSLAEISAAGSLPTAGKAPDYLLLDFFNMPIVEPYPISDSFSTAGRVNMNFQIAPFTYIHRDTALRGVLESTLITAVQDEHAQDRKRYDGRPTDGFYSDGPTGPYTQYLQATGHWAFRYPIHAGETLKQFDERFRNGDIFRSPAEICSLWLYPATQPTAAQPENPGIALVNWDNSSSAIKSWWYDTPGANRKSVTSDNMRERPYATLYPRLTTKSNTYTTYFRVQTLQRDPAARPDEWIENRNRVKSEYRGSAMIERYIDVSDPNLPDFAAAANAETSLDSFYRYRVINTKRFNP